MENVNKAFLVVVCFMVFSVSGQITFHKLFNGNSYDYGYGLTQTEDSSYLICGASSSFADAPSQAFILKTDSLGTFQWSKDFGGNLFEEFRRVKYIENYRIFAGGYTTSQGAGGYDGYLVATDINGELVWEKTFGGENWERVVDMTILPDSGLFVLGSTASYGEGGDDWYLSRYDKDGNELWNTTAGTSYDDEAKSCTYYQGNIYISGNFYNEDSLMVKARLAKYDLLGTQIWSKEVNFEGQTTIDDFVISENQIRGVGSSFDVYDSSSEDLWVRYTLDGAELANFKSSKNGELHSKCVVSSLDSTKLFTVTVGRNTPEASTYPDGFYDSFIIGFNNSYGFDNFAFNYSKTGNDLTYDMLMTLDGGAAMVGNSEFFNETGSEMFLVKIGPNGEVTQPDDHSQEDIVTINEDVLETSLAVFPNPTTGNISIRLESNISAISVFDNLGREIKKISPNNFNEISISELPNGVYILSILYDNQKSLVKVVKN